MKSNMNRTHKSLVAHLLCGILPLEVEPGRFAHKKVNREFRYCRLCEDLKIEKREAEDEIHFVFTCKQLADVRKAKLKPVLNAASETKTIRITTN